MPASIVFSKISWSTPDNRPVLTDLDIRLGCEKTGLVGRNGVGKSTLLKLTSGELRPASGTVTVSGTVGVLRQVVYADPAGTIADLFGASPMLSLSRKADAGFASVEELAGIDWTLEARLRSALQQVGLDVGAETPMARLSGGQQTRAALAALIFEKPDFLLLDEPTNNLDAEGRQLVARLLGDWRGGAVVVSHDRVLLDQMDAIVELTSAGATRYGGNWTEYQNRKALELAAAEREVSDAEKQVEEVARTAQIVRERKARKDGAGRRKGAKGDMPRILLGKMKNSSENTAGSHARLAESRQRDAEANASEARGRLEVLQPFSVSLPSTGLARTKSVLKISGVTAGYQPGQPVLQAIDFAITGPERVAVVGPNGSGKSTFLALVTEKLQPWCGQVEKYVSHAMLDQHVSALDPALSILDNFRRLNCHADDNACRASLARFMFRTDAALQTVSSLSGGELLRAGLACVLGAPQPPQLLILDEPTNHLDIRSIEAVEAGLRSYDGALLVVSHDNAFLDAINIARRVDLSALSMDS